MTAAYDNARGPISWAFPTLEGPQRNSGWIDVCSFYSCCRRGGGSNISYSWLLPRHNIDHACSSPRCLHGIAVWYSSNAGTYEVCAMFQRLHSFLPYDRMLIIIAPSCLVCCPHRFAFAHIRTPVHNPHPDVNQQPGLHH